MSLVRNVLRPRDLLYLQFEFVNLSVDSSGRLKREAPGDAFIVVRLPPQHIAEEPLDDGANRPFPLKAFLAGPSRLAFRVSEPDIPLPFTLERVLELLTKLPPVRVDSPPDGKPATVIEFPDRLLLIPEPRPETGTPLPPDRLRLFHRSAAPKDNSTEPGHSLIRNEIWHTRLGLEGGSNAPVHFRAVENSADSGRPNTSLTRRNRADIVARCARGPFIESSGIVLTALGAFGQLRSTWPPDTSTTLAKWDHHAVLGRDSYVRTLEHGFLFPFGHRASLEKITQREVIQFGPVEPAVLRTHSTLSVLEVETDYAKRAGLYVHGGREMPLKRVQIVTREVNDPPTLAPLSVDATAVDSRGNLISSRLTVFFLTLEEARNREFLEQTIEPIYKNPNAGHDTARFSQQSIALADDREARGDTTLDVTKLTFGVQLLEARQVPEPDQPLFLPLVLGADVTIPAISQMLGSVGGAGNGGAQRPVTMTYADGYLKNGFPPDDTKQVFARLTPIPGIAIPAERAGGLAALKLPDIDGLSRIAGPVSGVDKFVNPPTRPIDPAELIGEAKLLGSIALKGIIDTANSSVGDFPFAEPEKLYDLIKDDEPPPVGPPVSERKLLPRPVITTVRNVSNDVVSLETRFAWKPRVKNVTGVLTTQRPFEQLVLPTQLVIKGKITTVIGDPRATPTFEVYGKLRDFQLKLAGLVTVDFKHIEFQLRADHKMDVKTDIAGVSFEGGLSFIKEITNLIPKNGLGGASIHPERDGVVIRYGLGLPAASLGAFTIENVAFISSLSVPFVERPAAVRFSLSERSRPFTVSVAPFGGTGFFALEVRTEANAVRIEAAIEFGGIVSFSLFGIVQGAVYLLAGVYVAVSQGRPDITAHLRFGGYVDVLGIVTVSIEFYLSLNFENDVLIARGQLTIGVKVLFFSVSWSFEVEKKIASFGAKPRRRISTFETVMDRDQWAQYCKAFA